MDLCDEGIVSSSDMSRFAFVPPVQAVTVHTYLSHRWDAHLWCTAINTEGVRVCDLFKVIRSVVETGGTDVSQGRAGGWCHVDAIKAIQAHKHMPIYSTTVPKWERYARSFDVEAKAESSDTTSTDD
jgi:hypothetical protein